MKRIKRPRLMVGLTIGFIVLVGLIFSDKVISSGEHINGWVVTTPVATGTTLTAADVKSVQVPVGGDQFQILTQKPVGLKVALALQPGDLLTTSLLNPVSTAEVPLSVHMAPSLAPGDTVDIYAVVNGQTMLLARHMIIENANPLTILVSDRQEPLWISVAGSDTTLIMAQSTGIGVPSSNISALQSLQDLAGDTGGASSIPAGSGSASANPSPSLSAGSSQGG